MKQERLILQYDSNAYYGYKDYKEKKIENVPVIHFSKDEALQELKQILETQVKILKEIEIEHNKLKEKIKIAYDELNEKTYNTPEFDKAREKCNELIIEQQDLDTNIKSTFDFCGLTLHYHFFTTKENEYNLPKLYSLDEFFQGAEKEFTKKNI